MSDASDAPFDVIIVGAGPAGCVLASRLSDRPDKRILLLEAGPDPVVPGHEHEDIIDPFALRGSSNPTFHWPGLEVQVSRGAGRSPYVQGFGLGGASNINGMGVDFGQPGDFDDWEKLGADCWGAADVQPYFEKLDANRESNESFEQRRTMPIHRLAPDQWPPFAAAIMEAARRTGLPLLDDYLRDSRDGVGAAPMNVRGVQRVSAPIAYLTREVRARANLTIQSDTAADRILFEGRRATGVAASGPDGAIVFGGREIVLCSGAIQSPALLLRSGIGPHGHLEQQGIDVVADLPGVGENLRNHPCVTLPTYLTAHGRQALDNPSFLSAWIRFSSGHPGCKPHDMHLMPFNKCDWHRLGRSVGAMTISVMDAYSLGTVRLNKEATAGLDIDFNLLSDERDFERLVAGTKFMIDLLRSPEVAPLRHQAFAPNPHIVGALNARTTWNALRADLLSRLLDIGPSRKLLLSNAAIDLDTLAKDEEQLRAFVRKSASAQYHVCGTCKMGGTEDRDAVVSGDGQVRGVKGLRVADASIFPTVPRGYLHFIVLMTGEKIADDMQVGWRAS